MILTDDKQIEALQAQRFAEEQLHDPPPTYSSLQPPASTEPSCHTATTNYFSVSRLHNSVREKITLDPTLFVPEFLRPTVSPGEGSDAAHRHLKLESIHGNVYADVTLVDQVLEVGMDGRQQTPQRVLMLMKSTHGSVSAKIHGSPQRYRFVLHAQTTNGDIKLHIPRTFHGPIIVSHRHGSVKYSETITRQLTTFGEVDGTRRSFLGDFTRWTSHREAGWAGDELIIDIRHGNVRIHFDDETFPTMAKPRPTLLNKIFGF